MTQRDTNTNVAPWPQPLLNVLARMTYGRHGGAWRFNLNDVDRGQGCYGLTLTITAIVPDSYDPESTIGVRHLFPVPPAGYNEVNWRRWLFDQIMLVERHEAMEFFMVDGLRPFAPHHGPGEDPYRIVEHGTATDTTTRAV